MPSPFAVKFNLRHYMVGVAAGVSFKCALSRDGVLYSWAPCVRSNSGSAGDHFAVEFDGLSDGLYSFTARAAGDVTPAVVGLCQPCLPLHSARLG